MTDERRDAAPRTTQPETGSRWAGPMILAIVLLIPVGILIFSNLSTETVSWFGFEFTAPLWLILVATFVAGMIGGKLFGWAWRRYRRRRRRQKEELAVLRKHVAETERDARDRGDEG